tara:strand:- start:850 stop:1080 length:231 start_codon:yes stop_codon:yes gene_type:complete
LNKKITQIKILPKKHIQQKKHTSQKTITGLIIVLLSKVDLPDQNLLVVEIIQEAQKENNNETKNHISLSNNHFIFC